MANNNQVQAIRLLTSARNILILAESGVNADAVSASLALKEFLVKQDKQALVVAPNGLSPKLSFLPGAELIRQAVLSKNLLIEISLTKTQVGELNYEKSDDKLSVFVTPKQGEFMVSDVTVKPAVYPFDLIVTVGLSSLASLGKLFETHAQLFYETPIINIDCGAANELFAQVNLVNLPSAALSEVVFDLLSGRVDSRNQQFPKPQRQPAGVCQSIGTYKFRRSSAGNYKPALSRKKSGPAAPLGQGIGTSQRRPGQTVGVIHGQLSRYRARASHWC
jgi:hypothetical protein